MSAKTAPIIAPRIIPGNKAKTRGQRTAWCLWCAHVEALPVTIIVARDVPTARWVKGSLLNCNAVNTRIKLGTTIIPPPMPNSPALMPAMAPIAR